MIATQTFELLTPCFCAGFSQKHPELRVPSIRGQLRWWTRMFGGESLEYSHFGGIKRIAAGAGAHSSNSVVSPWKLGLGADPNNDAAEQRLIVPHKGYIAYSLPSGNLFNLTWQSQPHPDFKHGPDAAHALDFQRILKTWMLLGTVGRRATRAMGSVWPISYAPTIEEFTSSLTELTLPATLKWKVLDPAGTVDKLTRIAGETVHGLKMHQPHYHHATVTRNQGDRREIRIAGNPLGFVDRGDRKSSPLRFKVGRFSEGLRLIAIWDSRADRGGNLAAALPELSQPLLGLMQGFLAGPGAVPLAADPVADLLATDPTLPSFEPYKSEVLKWKAEGKDDLIARFKETTSKPKFAVLREQAWYPE